MQETVSLTFNGKFKALLLSWGMSDDWSTYMVDFSSLVLIFFIAVIIYYIAKFIINRVLKRLVQRTNSTWDDHLYENRVFTRLGLLLPALIVSVSLSSLTPEYPVAVKYIELLTHLYIICVVVLVITSFLNAIQQIYRSFEVSNARPIKSYLQIVKIIVLVISGIVMISVIMGKSPMAMLAGLGAMSAITMLVFKDSILGFVAGIQLTSNQLLRIGDWITVPKFNADGTVLDISLVSIKVRNFDNSVCVVPAYSLITDSFINWRSFPEAGGRRLKRSFLIDVRTIRPADDPFFDRLREAGFPVEEWTPDHRDVTNLTLFRSYLAWYLRNQRIINKKTTLMIRHLQPTENGLPVEIYAFYNSPDWVAFENFQAAFFEHIYAMLPVFELTSFQRISNIVPEIEKAATKS